MPKVTALNFGILSAWAARAGYSAPYYKRAFAHHLKSVGRLSYTQGKPALRVSTDFIASATEYAKSIEYTKPVFTESEGLQRLRCFFLGQDGLLNTATDGSDFVQFAVKGAYVYVHACQLSGRVYFVEGALMLPLGGSK